MSTTKGDTNHVLKGRQLDCMLLVKEGLTSKQVARELGISPRTVDQHIAGAIESLGVSNRTAAVSRLHELDRGEGASIPEPSFMLADRPQIAELHVIEADVAPRIIAILPPLGGQRNLASRRTRRDWMVRIAIACIMLTALAILTILGISELAGSFEQ